MPRGRRRAAFSVQVEVLNDDFEFEQYVEPHAPGAAENMPDGSNDGDPMDYDLFPEANSEEYQLGLSRHFGSSSNCIMLFKSEDGREAHFLTPQYDLETASLQALLYGFLGLRWVKVAEGERLVSFCKNPSCSTAADDGSLYEGADFASSPAQVLFGEHSTLCTCAKALIEAAGGEPALRSEVDSAQMQPAGTGIAFHSMGHTFQVIQAGCHFRDWGIVKGRKCQTCEGQQSRCPHLQKLRGEDPGQDGAGAGAADWLPPAVFEAKLKKVSVQSLLISNAMAR